MFCWICSMTSLLYTLFIAERISVVSYLFPVYYFLQFAKLYFFISGCLQIKTDNFMFVCVVSWKRWLGSFSFLPSFLCLFSFEGFFLIFVWIIVSICGISFIMTFLWSVIVIFVYQLLGYLYGNSVWISIQNGHI